MQSELLTETVRLFRNRPRSETLEKIQAATGLHPGWLSSLSADPLPARPSVYMVETLYNYLSDEPLSFSDD